MKNILIIDDNRDVGDSIIQVASHIGFNALWTPTISEARRRARLETFDLVMLDDCLPDGDGYEFLSDFKQRNSAGEVIMMTEFNDPKGAELAIKEGAFDYLLKPITIDKLRHVLTLALAYSEERQRRDSNAPMPELDRRGIVGESPALMTCINHVADAAATQINVLITGETGTGKERFAEAIHYNSRYKDKPFVVVDCASLPNTLVESTLFGYERGAFTGADKSKDGLVKQANGGSLFLDEIGELPLDMQKKFLRVLQERTFRPVGSKKLEKSDFRLIAATNRNLVEMAARGKFREDLLFRLKAMTIDLPPLRRRKEDLKLLVEHFLHDICNRYRLEMKEVSNDFFDVLSAYDWPGNVRELYQVMENTVVNASSHTTVFPQDLPSDIRINVVCGLVSTNGPAKVDESIWGEITFPQNLPTIKELREGALSALMRAYTRELIQRTGGNIEEAQKIAGLSRSRIYAFIKKYNIRDIRPRTISEETLRRYQ